MAETPTLVVRFKDVEHDELVREEIERKTRQIAEEFPETTRLELPEDFVAPRTEMEMELAKIWADVLELDSVAIHDNFFELGGHSLTATMIINQIRSRMNVELPLLTIFVSPTIAEMSGIINSMVDP